MVKNMVRSRHASQVVTSEPKREPLQMSKLPAGPWRERSADFGEIHSDK